MLVAASDRSDPVLGGFYKDIHAHPELPMQAERTSAKAAERLEAAGFEATRGVGRCFANFSKAAKRKLGERKTK